MKFKVQYSYESLSAALEEFLPTLQERQVSIVLNVFKSYFTLGFNVASPRSTGFVVSSITSASVDSPVDNVAGRLHTVFTQHPRNILTLKEAKERNDDSL